MIDRDAPVPHPSSEPDIAEVAAALGSTAAAVTPVGWGDARATIRLLLADGREYAIRRLPGPDATAAYRIASRMTRFAEAGLPTVRPGLISTAQATWLSVPWVDGTTGAAWLGEPARARHLADRMGQLIGRIARLDPAAFGPMDALDDDGDTIIDIEAWLATVDLEPSVRRAMASAIRSRDVDVHRLSSVVHGDFAPVNVIVGDDGEIKALLDLEHARLSSPLMDVAWWGWVVRHHHPEAWAAAWPTFRSAAGVDADVTDAGLHALALLELARRASAAADVEARGRWKQRLVDAATWTFAGADQPT